MSDNPRQTSGRSLKPWVLGAAVAVAGALAYALFALKPDAAPPLPQLRPVPPEATAEEVHRLCAACHAYPPPDTFPRSAWRMEVKQGYDFFHKDLSYRFAYPPLEAVIRYYENRAPEEFKPLARTAAPQPPAARFEQHAYRAPGADNPPFALITNPTNNASFAEPATINIRAGAQDFDGAVTNVAFYAGTNKLGQTASSPYSGTPEVSLGPFAARSAGGTHGAYRQPTRLHYSAARHEAGPHD